MQKKNVFNIDTKKRWILVLGFFLILGALIFTTHNDSFYQKNIVKIIRVDDEFSRKELGPSGEVELYYTQVLTGILHNGLDKGKKIEIGRAHV